MTALELQSILGEIEVEDPELCAHCGELASECTCPLTLHDDQFEYIYSLIK